MSLTDGFVGLFKSPEVGSTRPKVTSLGTITFQVTEVVKFVADKFSASSALIDIADVDVVAGKITKIAVQHKKSSDATWSDAYLFAVDFPSGTNTSYTAKIVLHNIEAEKSGVNHDFRAWFLNSDDKLAVDASSGNLIGVPTASGGAGFLQANNVTFDGVDDLGEYLEVKNLKCVNASNPEGDLINPVELDTNIAVLKWDDVTALQNNTDFTILGGGTKTMTPQKLRLVSGYIVFMFISTSGSPPVNEYPTLSDVNGVWYRYASNIKNNTITVQLPAGKTLAFWVGFMINPIPTSSTAGIPDISEAQYGGA
jgi:hypothetical protein